MDSPPSETPEQLVGVLGEDGKAILKMMGLKHKEEPVINILSGRMRVRLVLASELEDLVAPTQCLIITYKRNELKKTEVKLGKWLQQLQETKFIMEGLNIVLFGIGNDTKLEALKIMFKTFEEKFMVRFRDCRNHPTSDKTEKELFCMNLSDGINENSIITRENSKHVDWMETGDMEDGYSATGKEKGPEIILIDGDHGVGKKTFLSAFMQYLDVEEENCEIGVAGSIIPVHFVLNKNTLRKGEGVSIVVFLFDVTRQETFENIFSHGYPDLQKKNQVSDNTPVFMLGNKWDLRRSKTNKLTRPWDAQKRFHQEKSPKWFYNEISASQNANLNAVFEHICEALKDISRM